MSLMQSAPLYAGRQAAVKKKEEEEEEEAEDKADDPDAVRLAFISLIGWHLPC